MSLKVLFYVGLAALAVYEVVAAVNTVGGDTISQIVWRVSAERPILPFLFGLVCGHLFWSRSRPSFFQGVGMKSLFASKTFWVNLVSGAVALLESQDVLNLIPDQAEATLTVVVFALNIVLRYITTQPVKPLLGEQR